jgi:type IV secretion system protein VirD4
VPSEPTKQFRPVGWRPSRDQVQRYQEMDEIFLRVGVYAAAGLAVVALIALSAGHLAALAYSGGLPRYEPGDVPGILWGIVMDPGDPGGAWEPVNTGAELPGPLGWWAIFAVLVLVIGSLAFLVYALYSTRPNPQAPKPTTQWAKASTQPSLMERKGEEGRLTIGTSGRTSLALSSLQSLLVVGPAHAGKTSGLAIPALLEWPGPAVVASTKGHLMDETIGWRSHQGEVHVFDPAAVSRYHRSGWSLLSGCGTWQGAIRTAQHLTAAAHALPGARVHQGQTGELRPDQLWSSAMALSLAPFLYAAAADGRPILDAAEWIEREERDEVVEILRPIDQRAADAHETTFFRSDPSRSGFFHLMFQILSVYSDPTVAASAAKDEIVAAELLDGGSHTLYLTAPEHDQARFLPLFATIVRQIRTAVDDRFASERRPVDPPLLLLLDEAVGVASVDDLASIASTGAAKGVQVVSIFQDLGRFEGLHGDAGGLLAKSHRALMVVAGQQDVAADAPSPQRHHWAELGARLAPGEAALRYGSAKPVRLRLRRWYQDSQLSKRVHTEQDAVEPVGPVESSPSMLRSRSPVDRPATYSLVAQTGMWPSRATRRERRRSDDPLGQDSMPPDELPDNVTRLRDPDDPSPP